MANKFGSTCPFLSLKHKVPEMPFLTRETVQERLHKRIEDGVNGFRQNIGLIGSPGVGKSHLLKNFFQSISRDSRLLSIFIRGETIDDKQLVEQWLGAVLCSVLIRKTSDIPSSLSGLIQHTEPLIPSTVQAVKHVQRLFHQEKKSSAVRELFGLSSILARETGKKVVLIIDELQGLEKLPVTDPFAMLGKQIMPAKEVLYLVTSSARDRALEIFRNKLSLLFGNFELLELGPFGFFEMEKYLAGRMPTHRWTEPLKRFLFHMTDGEPLYVDLMIQCIEKMGVREIPQPVTPASLIDAFCQELFDDRGRIALRFEQKIQQCASLSGKNGVHKRVLISLSQGRRKVIPIAASIAETVTETQKVLKRLVQEGLIVKSGSFYHLPDILFRFWIREVYLKRHALFLPEGQSLRKSLFDKLNAACDSCARMHNGDVGARVETMLKEFRNDTVEFSQKKFQCPQFSETALRVLPNSLFAILGKGGRGRWLFYVGAETIDERAVENLLKDSKNLRNIRRKILIALSGIEQNAKLIAQEAKMQIWDLRQLNVFMDYYDLPKIIITSQSRTHGTEQKTDGSIMGAVAQNVSALNSR